jgi:hypothetical protein
MKALEDKLQIACAKYLALQYPNMLWHHTPNGGSRNAIEGAKLKRMGTKPGVADILILEQNKSFTGLAIELKCGKNKPTPEQVEFLNRVKRRGWEAKVIYNIDDFIKVVDEYMSDIEVKHIIIQEPAA